VIYVGNAEDSSGDQVLEEVMVGPVSIGINRFVLQANAPNPAIIANQDLIGVTVILITCSFMDNKFVQIGYYVNNEYTEPFEPENFPNPVDISKLYRNILADQPRVTRFAIDWSGETSGAGNLMAGSSSAEANQAEDDEDVSELSFIGMLGCSSVPVYGQGCNAYTHAMSASLTRKLHFFCSFALLCRSWTWRAGRMIRRWTLRRRTKMKMRKTRARSI
jgi:histone chaperone ASF1